MGVNDAYVALYMHECQQRRRDNYVSAWLMRFSWKTAQNHNYRKNTWTHIATAMGLKAI